MFGLFKPSCPLNLWIKTWIEWRMLWFVQRFGINRLRNARVITPTDEFFPSQYGGGHADVRRCFTLMCGYMAVDASGVALEILPDELMPGAVGLYERGKGTIYIAESQVADPPRLLATLSHEIAHEILLRGGHLSGYEADHEITTDLLPVFLGTGIFGANATLRDSSGRDGNASWWSISRQGYLSSLELGYALALFAFARDEDPPEWAHHLRTDARETLAAGLRFLRKTGDSLFTPDAIDSPKSPLTADQVIERLESRSATVRLATLWELADGKMTDSRVLEMAAHSLNDREDTIRGAATCAVSAFGPAAASAVPRIIEMLSDRSTGVRVGAAGAVAVLNPPAGEVVPELSRMLLDEATVAEAARALRKYGRSAEKSLPNLLTAVERTVEAGDETTAAVFDALRAICPEPRKEVREHFGDRDPDLLRLALNELKKHEG